jgi:hypothetical protein
VIKRGGAWLWQLLICLDQLFATWLRGWWYVWVGGELPNADETLSSFVGRRSLAGQGWARIAERALDAIFGTGHCRRSIGR